MVRVGEIREEKGEKRVKPFESGGKRSSGGGV